MAGLVVFEPGHDRTPMWANWHIVYGQHPKKLRKRPWLSCVSGHRLYDVTASRSPAIFANRFSPRVSSGGVRRSSRQIASGYGTQREPGLTAVVDLVFLERGIPVWMIGDDLQYPASEDVHRDLGIQHRCGAPRPHRHVNGRETEAPSSPRTPGASPRTPGGFSTNAWRRARR